ncbi:MAG: Rne/Rng family ribonuclease [Alphaproteobacteria bacterium]|nr:Rne/Rng family ribonuclease [Alphaproteobacteria bacterium]
MSVDQILISTSPGETRTALLSGGRLVEFLIERKGRESLVGNIHMGRVTAVVETIGAAFVSIGQERDGFLALAEARPAGETGGGIGDFVNEGDAVLVQVQRDPVEDKGAKLTCHVSLAGAYLIFLPFESGVSVSRRITGGAERGRLKTLANSLAAGQGGCIVRTQAEDADEEDLREDAARLMERWRDIQEKADAANPPARVHEGAGLACRALRDFGGEALREIVVDDAGALNRVRGFCDAEMPWLAPLVSLQKGPDDLFEATGAAEQIDAAFRPKVGLAGGGSIIIGQTPALTAIDVNSGEQDAFKANLEAAAEIARQIRLRNISGLIVVDFLRLKDEGRKKVVLDALKKAATADPLVLNVAGFTRLGLVEMTRPRHGLSLMHVVCGPDLLEPVPSVETQALEALRRVLIEASVGMGGKAGVTLRAPEGVIAALKGSGGADSPAALALTQAQDRLGLAIGLEPDHTLAEGQCDITFGNGG